MADLESTVKDLELQLVEEAEEANRVIAKWQASQVKSIHQEGGRCSLVLHESVLNKLN